MHKNDHSPFSAWDFPLALVLLTRLPVPRLPAAVFARQSGATWAFPLVGVTVGALGAAAGWLALAANLPPMAAATLVVCVLVATTGAMHEDGLADTVDGLWGGHTVERRLEIMKDSQIGSYGVLALILSQLLRIAAVAALMTGDVLTGLIAACAFSRCLMPIVMRALPNARHAGLSHSVGVPPMAAVCAGVAIGGALAVFLLGLGAIVAMGFATLAALAVAGIARIKIGGQTGDILGATQQVSEIVFLLVLAALA